MTSANEKVVSRAVKELGVPSLAAQVHVEQWALGNPNAGDPSLYGVTQDQVNKIFAIYADVHGIELC